MEDHFKILSLAASNQLPDQIDESFEYPIDVVTELIEGGLLKVIDASSFGGTVYAQPKITIHGREYLRDLSLKFSQGKKTMPDSNLKLFNLIFSGSSFITPLFRRQACRVVIKNLA